MNNPFLQRVGYICLFDICTLAKTAIHSDANLTF